ncbi:tripartite tricarboxylate transporter substrate binding protein [Noviherbaspirillum suwonense]|jgi:tripartite-type tricarboxylate transporter receptor subunit TctC|uniref:Tat (Twin-arginine translocation) pathway signal sequence n=1 Tax=Noviherbaspirillum suwonense TaxID=1224511 RepID=A0ABY1Q9Z6_9BURK|nr:tripartite tricarboxylate transporter substrate binding protein [Noviherbaspirillum suwonense]SMP65074.1 Tat (twin-arginine translocation) pathway signal sequence [Noviherbaspirillum suwonense]
MSKSIPTRRDFLKTTAAAAATVAFPGIAQAQAFPSRPIKLICPWPAGGSTDIVMRAFAESAGKALGGQMIVENKPGAGGTLGAVELVNAKPDGYTLSQLPLGIFRLPHMQKVQFDPMKDLTYVACLTGYTFGMVVRADSPIKTMQEFVDYAKANPGKLSYGSTGAGTTPHLVVEQFARRAGIKLQHIPFKGNADGMQAVLGGHVMAHSDATGWGPHVDAGRCRLLATYGSKRTKRWASVPTLLELGYQTVSDSPFGIGAPAGMDPALTKRLQDAFSKSLQDPAVIAVLDKYDQPVIYLDSAGYTKFARETFEAERETITSLGLQAKT